MARPLLLGTRSQGKLRELRPLFEAAGFVVADLHLAGIPREPGEDAIEVGATFAENALAKARYYHRLSGQAVVADDSGLEVAALAGAPGIHSKRWCQDGTLDAHALDRANNALLLRRLHGATDRSARFVCAAAYVDADDEFVELGECAGAILTETRGDGGFGYDPLFFSNELGRTFSEADALSKERVSHRGRACAKLIARIPSRR